MEEIKLKVPYGYYTGSSYRGAIKGLVNPRTGEFHYIWKWYVSESEYLEEFEEL